MTTRIVSTTPEGFDCRGDRIGVGSAVRFDLSHRTMEGIVVGAREEDPATWNIQTPGGHIWAIWHRRLRLVKT